MVDDKELMHAFKKLLQHFQLAYPADEDVMQPESDLIVPTYWKVDRSISSCALLSQKSVCDAFREHRWCWEYEIPNELAEVIFDQFAVQSHVPDLKRSIHNGCINSQSEEYATSIKLVQQNANSDVIRVEVSGTMMERSWNLMRFYLMTLEKVIADGYSKISVERYILHRLSVATSDVTRYPIGPIVRAVKIAIKRRDPEMSVRVRMPWMPPDMMWFVGESWKRDIVQFQMLQMQFMVDAKLDVIRKLAIAGSAPRFPTLWSLERLADAEKVVVRVFSDLSGVCYHSPMEIATGSTFLKQYGAYFKAGYSVVSTVTTEALSVPLVDKAIGAIKTHLSGKVDHAVRIHNLIERLNIQSSARTTISSASTNDNTTRFESQAAKLPPDVARAVLHGLLKIYNDSSDELNISELTNLECVVTEGGGYVWAHEHEIAMLGDRVTRCTAPPSVWANLPEPSLTPQPTGSPLASPQSNSTSKFKLSLCVESVAGLTDRDWYKAYCTWQLFYGEASKMPIASGATTQNSERSSPPSWRNSKTIISSVSSVEMLTKCRLMVQVKRRSRIGWTKVIGEGTLSLQDTLTSMPDQPGQFYATQVKLDKTAHAPRVVNVQLAREA